MQVVAVNLGLHVAYAERERLAQMLREARSESLWFVLVDAIALAPRERGFVPSLLAECARVLRPGGLLFVHDHPWVLPEIGVHLDQQLTFKYWIAIASTPRQVSAALPSVHAGVLLFHKPGGPFRPAQPRAPHPTCAACGRYLKDWGGKAHLRHPGGYVLSDVWTHLAAADNYGGLSAAALEELLRLVGVESEDSVRATAPDGRPESGGRAPLRGIVGPREGLAATAEPPASDLGDLAPHPSARPPGHHGAGHVDSGLVNVVRRGDAVEVLRGYPDECVDLAFADPPYNLDKAYHSYDDAWERQGYVEWCNAWLREYVRVLKPGGSLFLLNLPHWALYHAAFLYKHLHFQSWIVWDAMSEPRGKLMPAHYALLYYTKGPAPATFNYADVSPVDARCYCLRQSCIRARKARGDDRKEPLTDIWRDVHRIRHPRDRDYHPCQLPEALLERIIRLATNEGDVVLDALCGTGTTALVALKLGRRYIAIDVDPMYVDISERKLAAVRELGYVPRVSTQKSRERYTKKGLQLALRDLAAQLGRLPTPEDVRRDGRYDVETYLAKFPSWRKALRAAVISRAKAPAGA